MGNAFQEAAPSKLEASYSTRSKQVENASSEAELRVQDCSAAFRLWQTMVPIVHLLRPSAAILLAKNAQESQALLPQNHIANKRGHLSISSGLRPVSKIRAQLFSSLSKNAAWFADR